MKEFEKLKYEIDLISKGEHNQEFTGVYQRLTELKQALQLQQTGVSKSLPDHYAWELNIKRIKAYKMLHEQYNLEEGTVRDIFCKGADWYKEQCREGNVC